MTAWLITLTLSTAGLAAGLIAALRRLASARRRLRKLAEDHQSLERAHLFHARAARQAQLAPFRRGHPPVEFRAGQGEDLLLWDLLSAEAPAQPAADGRGGVILECGAYDGLNYSVSYAFEALGWTAVLVEALPEQHHACLRNRPGARCVHAALSRRGSSGTTTFTVLDDGEDAAAASFLVNSPEHAARMRAHIRNARAVTVPITTADEALAAALPGPAPRVDLAVLDVEGGELDLLDGFDLDRFRVRVLLIEELSRGRDTRLLHEMARRGYTLAARIARNDLYIRNDETALLHRARQLSTFR
ncbi:MAG: FkbM family methyltransferase [Phycisphaerales bacterium]|nr:FkbM family methyltransferase [Phycisphaerales bacterium]